MKVYAATGNHWEETLYRCLARNFGFSLNALPFESLAKSLPLSVLQKHRDNLPQVEALLFGQAGMLNDENPNDTYYAGLRNEYFFLKSKYRLTPIDNSWWKFLRLRPINFPTLRIAQFAGLIHSNEHLFSQIVDPSIVKTYALIFNIKASKYWDSHFVFGKDSTVRNKSLGQTAIRTISVNTIVPFLFAYGKARGKETFCADAISILENLPPERNSILTRWEVAGMNNPNAFASQALLQLKNEYCSPRRCLDCVIGNRIVRDGNLSN